MAMRFRVLYKKPEMRAAKTLDMIMNNLKDLMQSLKLDGVTLDNVEYMYVHFYPQNTGETVEVVAVENGKSLPKENKIVDTKGVPIDKVAHLAKAAKPKIKAKDVADLAIVKQGLFTAMRGNINVSG